ncbi:MAG: hypothetical protein ACREH4_02090 [Vitreimonas sp.]
MSARAKQMNLFSEPVVAPAPADPEVVTRHLRYLLWLARTADRLPWSEAKTATWERLFGELAPTLPEGEDLLAAFQAELKRLRAA